MIVDVQKVLFVGPKSAQTRFFADMQTFGCVEFSSNSLRAVADGEQKKGTLGQISNNIAKTKSDMEQIVAALRILRRSQKAEVKPKEMSSSSLDVDQDDLSCPLTAALAIQQKQKDVEEIDKAIASLEDERKIARPFGSFDLAKLKTLAKRADRHLQFWICSANSMPEQIAEEMIEISRSSELFAGLSLTEKPQAFEPFRQVHLVRSIDEIDLQSKELKSKKNILLNQLQRAQNTTCFLERALEEAFDTNARQLAETGLSSLLDERLFTITGFVAKDRLSDLMRLIKLTSIHMQTAALDEGESAPTHMVNRGWARVGQDLTEIYDTPSSGDLDPSSWILWSFAIFFAMIIGDAGYGLLFLFGSLLINKKSNFAVNSPAKRALRLSCLLATFCIGWGVLSSAFFALPIAAKSPIRKISLITYLAEKKAQYHYRCRDAEYVKWSGDYPITAKMIDGASILQNASISDSTHQSMLAKFSDQILMELALLVGIAHICTSLLRYLRRNWPALGWSLFLLGAYALVPKLFDAIGILQFCFGIQPQIAHFAGQILMLFGGSLALGAAFFQHGSAGILEVMNLIQIGADVLSYLRIYALGLSGAIMANTINEGAGAVGVIFAPFVLLIGHSINLLLGLMGGVIHGLRLNFLEWYHYSFEGGGRPHKPLQYLRQLR